MLIMFTNLENLSIEKNENIYKLYQMAFGMLSPKLMDLMKENLLTTMLTLLKIPKSQEISCRLAYLTSWFGLVGM